MCFSQIRKKRMDRGKQGYTIPHGAGSETYGCYVPLPLPPSPDIVWDPALRSTFEKALYMLGQLDSMARLLPDTTMFLYMYVRKEAVLSSMIEGTQSTLSDLMLFELDEVPGVPLDDVREVSRYVAALEHGIDRIRHDFPISLRLIRELHAKLLERGRGSDQTPGEFRRSQNWIKGSRPGNAAFVPPPPAYVIDTLGELEKFINDVHTTTPVLLKAALAHVQFETIHPFLDGNGRVGRLLIPLILMRQGFLREPLLYVSLYFKQHRERYYALLMEVRHTGDWEAWLAFFAEAVIATTTQAVDSAEKILQMIADDTRRISGLGRAGLSALAVYQALCRRPISNTRWLIEQTGLTFATVNKSLQLLASLRIVEQRTVQKRNRTFVYSAYIELLNRGTELPT
jgi:Fic family protein